MNTEKIVDLLKSAIASAELAARVFKHAALESGDGEFSRTLWKIAGEIEALIEPFESIKSLDINPGQVAIETLLSNPVLLRQLALLGKPRPITKRKLEHGATK